MYLRLDMCVTFQTSRIRRYTMKLKNAGKQMNIKQHFKNVFKIIFGMIDLHVHYRNIISRRVSAVCGHLLGLSPQWRIRFSPSPPTPCLLIASEGQGSLLSTRHRAGCAGAIYSSTLEMHTHKQGCKCPCWVWLE